ncbi:Aspartate kinase [Phycisphaerales bacterium]|nr:Aspartate kinase [Phycisphaerales bacterium]
MPGVNGANGNHEHPFGVRTAGDACSGGVGPGLPTPPATNGHAFGVKSAEQNADAQAGRVSHPHQSEPHRESRQPVIVLKLGGSVLTGEAAIASAVEEVRGWVSRGYGVVAVVSAFEGETDRLLSLARSFGREAWATAALVATGEHTSAAALALALDAGGVSAATLDAAGIGLRTSAEALDASPRDLDVEALRTALSASRVVVVPGFVGRDERLRTTLLGRGGSDLTALFIAGRLRARCRLVKDVPGLFERDPKVDEAARLYSRVSWDGALALDGGIVQQKGVRFAKEIGLEFEVGALGEEFATRVGGEVCEFAREGVRASGLQAVREECAA